MPYAEECENPFYVDPMVLFKLSLAPSIACSSNAVNALIRGSVVVAIVCVAVATIYGPLIGVFGVVVIAALYGPSLYATWIGGAPEAATRYRQQSNNNNEGFEGALLREKRPPTTTNTSPEDEVNVIGTGALSVTSPNARNPFMNVLLDELKYNPRRPAAADVTDPLVKTELDDFFRVQWSSDPTDVFGKAQSQREFYTVPSTSVPNDVESYQNWLYKIPGKTCKEGGPCVAYNNSPLVSNWIGT